MFCELFAAVLAPRGRMNLWNGATYQWPQVQRLMFHVEPVGFSRPSEMTEWLKLFF